MDILLLFYWSPKPPNIVLSLNLVQPMPYPYLSQLIVDMVGSEYMMFFSSYRSLTVNDFKVVFAFPPLL